MKSTILSMSLATLFVGNTLDAVIMKINYFNEFWSFIFFAMLMLLTACVFLALAWNYKVRDFTIYDNAEVYSKELSIEMPNAALESGHGPLLQERTPVWQVSLVHAWNLHRWSRCCITCIYIAEDFEMSMLLSSLPSVCVTVCEINDCWVSSNCKNHDWWIVAPQCRWVLWYSCQQCC